MVFREVIRSESIGAGAKALGLTQPAVSKIIGDMESYFGSELTRPAKYRRLASPRPGRYFNWSEAITREMKNMVNEMNALTNSAVVDVSFGFLRWSGLPLCRRWCISLNDLPEGAGIDAAKRSSPLFYRRSATGVSDFAIGTLSDEMKLQDLYVEPLFESEFVLVANRARIGNGTVRLASPSMSRVPPETNMGYYSELLATLQRSAASAAKISSIPIRW